MAAQLPIRGIIRIWFDTWHRWRPLNPLGRKRILSEWPLPHKPTSICDPFIHWSRLENLLPLANNKQIYYTLIIRYRPSGGHLKKHMKVNVTVDQCEDQNYGAMFLFCNFWPPSDPPYLHPPIALFLLFPRLLFVISSRLELRLPADGGRCGTKHKSPV